MRALIIANGVLPSRDMMDTILAAADLIVCADGGANHTRKLALTPDVILGDLDSISAATKKFYRHIPQILVPDQNSTDLEKAIQFCVRRKIPSANIVGVTGDRLDHVTGSIGCFKKYGRRIELTMIDSRGILELVKGTLRLRTSVGARISLIPVDHCSGVTTTHLKYPLKNDDLELGVREGISNEATAKNVTIRVRRGTLLCYRFHARPK